MADRPDRVAGSSDTEPGELGISTETLMFLIIGALTIVLALVYTVASDDPGGQILLWLGAGFSLIMASFLAVRDRRGGHELVEEAEPVDDGPPPTWFPAATIWPFTVSAGIALVVAGLALGLWVLLPGAFVLAQGVWSFTMQSRRRGA